MQTNNLHTFYNNEYQDFQNDKNFQFNFFILFYFLIYQLKNKYHIHETLFNDFKKSYFENNKNEKLTFYIS